MNNSTRTIRGISKGKRKAAEICYHIATVFNVTPETEYRFAAILSGGTGKGSKERIKAMGLKDWRMDIAIPEYMICIELDGGTWSNGRHSRGLGVISDMNKLNAATVNGWRVLRYTHTNHTLRHIMADVSRIINR